MNKKIIVSIICGVLALAIIAVAAIFVIKSIHTNKPDTESSEPTISSSSDTQSEKENTSSASSNTSNTSSDVISGGSIGIKDTSASTGDTVKIPIYINENPGIFAGQFYFEFDSSALEYIDYEKGDLFDEYDVEVSDGIISCIINSEKLKDVDKNGTIITLVFYVKDSAKAGKYEITLGNKTMLCNLNEQIVDAKLESDTITVK